MNINFKITVSMIFFVFVLVSCKQNPYKQGERIYKQYCVNCHMQDGNGFRLLYPPLKNSDYLATNFDKLPCIIRHGLADTIQVNGIQFNLAMLGIKELNTIEITNLVNYINYKWNYRDGEIKLEEVKSQLDQCTPIKDQPGISN